MTEDNLIQFPVVPRKEAIDQGKVVAPAKPKKSSKVRVISSFAPADNAVERSAYSPEGTGVAEGKEVRACINRIGEWLDTIDAMRGEVDDVILASNLATVEAALAGIVFMHKPVPSRTA